VTARRIGGWVIGIALGLIVIFLVVLILGLFGEREEQPWRGPEG
jgi:hypothetical protein